MLIPRILIDGIGDIAPNVIWSQTEINAAAQGDASLSTLILRDFDVSPYAFLTGKRVIMDFGSDETRFFGGYLWKASRRHWFPVDDPTHIQRQWRLQLVDNNILFTRRVVFKKADPAHVGGPMYGPGILSSPCDETAGIVYDDTAIAELVANWLDLSIDGIDASTLVHEVASITYGQVMEPWNAGMTFGDAMKIIAQLPAAIFYLNQWWQLIYADVDVATAPFGLSDRPAADGAQGYREMTIWDDGSHLANDALGWGAGKGVDHMVFDRETDTASVAEHRLWQDGFTLWNVWCQPTIDKYIHTDLYGSPSSLRGRKDEVQSVELVTHAQGLYPGQVVRFRNHEYGVDVNIPVRSSKITFDAPNVPKYTLKLAHVLDKYGFQDPSPKFPGGGGPGGKKPPPGLPPPSTPCLGLPWTVVGGGFSSVDGNYGVLRGSGLLWPFNFSIQAETISPTGGGVDGPWTASDTWTLTAKFQFASIGSLLGLYTLLLYNTVLGKSVYVQAQISPTTGNFRISMPTVPAVVQIAKTDWVPNSDYLIKWEYVGGGSHRAKIWLATETEPDWMVTATAQAAGTFLADTYLQVGISAGATIWSTKTNYIDFGGGFDSFNRTVLEAPNGSAYASGGWGISDCGGGSGAPLSGPLCETITSTGDTLTTSAPYLSGSTRVWVDGVFMRPGTYAQVIAEDREYNELDPATGTILFGASRTRTVLVCYTIG